MREAWLWRPADNGAPEESGKGGVGNSAFSDGGSDDDLSAPESLKGGVVQCLLCRQFCRLEPGAWGWCGVRVNQDGTLYTIVDDQVAALGEEFRILRLDTRGHGGSSAAPGVKRTNTDAVRLAPPTLPTDRSLSKPPSSLVDSRY